MVTEETKERCVDGKVHPTQKGMVFYEKEN